MTSLLVFLFSQFLVIAFLTERLHRANNNVTFYRHECAEWQVAAVHAGTLLVLSEDGEHAMDRWKIFARYNPPEVVRECLPHPKEFVRVEDQDPNE